MTERYADERYGNWIAIDNDPMAEESNEYLVAWLPKGLKRSECFVDIMTYYPVSFWDAEVGWDTENLKKFVKKYWNQDEVELYAWMPLPDMYKII